MYKNLHDPTMCWVKASYGLIGAEGVCISFIDIFPSMMMMMMMMMCSQSSDEKACPNYEAVWSRSDLLLQPGSNLGQWPIKLYNMGSQPAFFKPDETK